MLKKLPAANRSLVFVVCLSLTFFNSLFSLDAPRSFAHNEVNQASNADAIRFTEDFDGVAIPQLPVGWVTQATGAGLPFATQTTTRQTPPNAIFTNNSSELGTSQITTPPIALGNLPSRISFRHAFWTELQYDGGVLEIKIGNGNFLDIVQAGGEFRSGGYSPGVLNTSQSPLSARRAWTGNSGFNTGTPFIFTEIELPANAAGQVVEFRWRFASDEKVNVPNGGWWVDSIQIVDSNPQSIGYSENFDAVTVPALPSGWTTGQNGAGTPFVTRNDIANTPPNSVFTTSPGTPSSAEIVSPPIRIGSSSPKLIFNHRYQTEATWDGGVLEIKIGDGDFVDIIAAGGTFALGAYNGSLRGVGNPLAGRNGWTGNSVNFITTEVSLPLSAHRQLVQFRWRHGSDDVVAGVGWWIDSVRITNVITAANPTSLTFPSSGIASRYPSEIQVSGLPGAVTRVSVNIDGFTHTAPDDIDVLLVSPNGKSVVLMSDVGGNNAVNNLFLTFEDTASSSLPDNELIVSGAYKPTDFESGDAFPAPAPATPPTGTKLLSLFNSQPNGAWQLYAVDDTGGNTGAINGGWSITVDTSTSAIEIPALGNSLPYPSETTVSNQTGLISKVVVNIDNFNHESPDDVDLLLVAPNGRKVILMSDVGGTTEVNNRSLIFDDSAPAFLPDNSIIASGSYKPTDFEPGDLFPAPAPTDAPTNSKLSIFNGSEPNGTWKLFLVDDTGNNSGAIFSWTLLLQTSPNAIAVPEIGIAQPYPSDLIVTGLEGAVTRVTVTLTNFSHAAPDDVDILLVAPNGRRMVLMSDVGGTTEVGSLNLVFDDNAPNGLPDNAALTAGTYKPTDFEPDDVFPAPAPSGALSGTTLNAFYGSPANGAWRLFVVDDAGNNLGSIAGGWSLNITTSPNACSFFLQPQILAVPNSGGGGTFTVNMPSGCQWTAESNSGFVAVTAGAAGGGAGQVTFNVQPNTAPARTGRITVSNGISSQQFQIQQASGCPTSLSSTALNFAAAGGTGTVQITAAANCSWLAVSNSGWITVTSPSTSGSGDATFNVAPNNGAARTGSVTVGNQTIVVNQAGSRAARFDFDGDGRSDIAVWRPANGTWYALASQSSSLLAQQFGATGDRPVAADYDGDGTTDVAVFRSGDWYILQSSNNSLRGVQFGIATDQPAPADYDGDKKADVAVYRDGSWYVLNSSNNEFRGVQFGIATDLPVAADFDGDNKADIAVYRPGANATQTSRWFYLASNNNNQFVAVEFGVGGDTPVAADYDGDSKADIAVFRAENGTWHISVGTQPTTRQWGTAGDIAAPADYDGDGKTDFAVFRQGAWFILTATNQTRSANWGVATDIPVSGRNAP